MNPIVPAKKKGRKGGQGRGKSRRSVEYMVKVNRALELRLNGVYWEEIAKLCGWKTRQAAQQAVTTELERNKADSIEQHREINFRRLERLYTRTWMAGAKEGDPSHVNTAKGLLEREARLLGLDKQPEPSTPVVSLAVVPGQWTKLRETIFRVLERYPEALEAIVTQLEKETPTLLVSEGGTGS